MTWEPNLHVKSTCARVLLILKLTIALAAYVISVTCGSRNKKITPYARRRSIEKRLHLSPAKKKKMAKPTLISTITIRRQYPSRSSFSLFPWSQSLRCLHTTTVRPKPAYQSITTRQPAQASPMLLAKQQYLKTRIKDLGILPGMYRTRRKKKDLDRPPSYMYIYISIPRKRECKDQEWGQIGLRLVVIYTTGTFIMPTGDKKPSLLREPRRRWRLEFHRLKCRITDLRG